MLLECERLTSHVLPFPGLDVICFIVVPFLAQNAGPLFGYLVQTAAAESQA